jgi:hypothetical protein
MGEGMGQRWLPLKKYWELGRDKQLVFCSDYVQRAYSFPKSTKEVFCEEGVWHSLNKLPTMIHDQDFRITGITRTPHRDGFPVCHPAMRWTALWVWILGTFTSAQ